MPDAPPKKHDLDDLLGLLDRAGVAAGRVNTAADICDDPHIAARGSLTRVRDPETGGSVLMQSPVGRFSSLDTEVRTAGPALGSDTLAVLSDQLGLDEEELAELAERGVI